MSHTYAARCTVCGEVDDWTCPECGTPSSTTHGITDQRPWTSPAASGGYVHEWHPECLTTTEGDDRE
jgi:hypothetical protein